MSTNPQSSDITAGQTDSIDQPLTWFVFRARETPRKTVLVSTLVGAIIIFVALTYQEPIMVLLTVLAFTFALSGYYLPTRYTADRTGISIDKTVYRFSRPWSDFRSFVRTTGGVVISPFSNWTYLDNFRGIHLLLPQDPAPVLKYLAERLPEKKRPSKRTPSSAETGIPRP